MLRTELRQYGLENTQVSVCFCFYLLILDNTAIENFEVDEV